jgi:protocatechuate 3,4-dioxygenase, beta subunit
MAISRREAVTGALTTSMVATSMVAAAGRAQAQGVQTKNNKLEPTGQETLGPFYPVRAPVSHDLDLTHYPGRQGRAMGQVIQITGRVFDVSGRPLPKAEFKIWQANAAGRYTNPVDDNPAPLDPNFLGTASFGVAADGSYRLRTVKPGAYPEPTGTMRTPHIHFDVINADYRLVAQMYFPGEKLNRNDILLSTLSARHRDPAAAICKPVATSEPGVMAFTWDIVLLT